MMLDDLNYLDIQHSNIRHFLFLAMKIAITGATGFIGSRLTERLSHKNHEIVVFTRNSTNAYKRFPKEKFPKIKIIDYDPTQPGDWQAAISGCDAVVNLAGEPIAERWSASYKQAILESRQRVTHNLVDAVHQATVKPKVLVNASAIGYYGTSEIETFTENSPAGQDFLAQVCQTWEAEAKQVENEGVRLAIVRIGIVLGDGGALAKMLPPFKLFAGGPIGNGRQWFSWIHRDDLVGLMETIIENPQLKGVFNGTAPNPVRMAQLCQVLGEVLNRPSWLPVPNLALELLLGEAAKVVLEGQQVLPQRAEAANFHYQYPTVKEALQEILSRMG